MGSITCTCGLAAIVGDGEMFGPDAVDDLASVAAAGRGGERQAHAAGAFEFEAAVGADGAFEKVHRRRADEARDEQISRPVVELERRADLLNQPVMHHDDPVGHGHGFDLVVGHIDGRRLQALMQFLDLGAHGHPQLGVEVGQRLVEQEYLRIAHDRAAHGDALALAAGELARIAVEQMAEGRGYRRRALHRALDLRRRAHRAA